MLHVLRAHVHICCMCYVHMCCMCYVHTRMLLPHTATPHIAPLLLHAQWLQPSLLSRC